MATQHTNRGTPGRDTTPRPTGLQSDFAVTLRPQAVFLFLLALRIANALTIQTFFQPDEYFQALEPAWQTAFGLNSGAWITWEWHSKLRSCIHPALFAAVYGLTSAVVRWCNVDTGPLRSELLIAAPKVLQAVFAALTDFFTWKLAERTFGRATTAAQTALVVTVCSPWQWFCSTRTLSNSLETTITIAALSFWPWPAWPDERDSSPARDGSRSRLRQREGVSAAIGSGDGEPGVHADTPSHLDSPTTSLLLAALACILRPTNVLIWLCPASFLLLRASAAERRAFVLRAVSCGTVVLAASLCADRVYYGTWTLPAANFLHANLSKDVAVFYGRNRADYYLTEGIPLLTTTALPFALLGLWQALAGTSSTSASPPEARHTLRQLAATILLTVSALSAIAHKEVRFAYPLLPSLHVLASPPLNAFFLSRRPTRRFRAALLALLLALNLLLAAYTTLHHQRGVISVLTHLRRAHEARAHRDPAAETTVAFLMPCHSTPWRSHLVHARIDAWALTCEPPLHARTAAERDAYEDEADQFYADPPGWLAREMGQGTARRAWPGRLVLFEQLLRGWDGAVARAMADAGYAECWRGWNSHWHDDWRRKGDVLVFCRGEGAETG